MPPFRLLLIRSRLQSRPYECDFTFPPFRLSRAGLGFRQENVKGFKTETEKKMVSPDELSDKKKRIDGAFEFVFSCLFVFVTLKYRIKSGFGPSCRSLAVFHVNSFCNTV